MPNVAMKNLFRFSSLALASVGSILGGPLVALSLPVSDVSQNIDSSLKSQTESSIGNNLDSLSQEETSFNSQSDYHLISSSKFEGISSSIGSSSNAFTSNTLSDSSSVSSGNSNPASYYWYRRNKNKNISPSAVRAAFLKESSAFSSQFSDTMSKFEDSTTTVSETLTSTFSSYSSSPTPPRLGKGFSGSGASSSLETMSESISGESMLTSSFSQSF